MSDPKQPSRRLFLQGGIAPAAADPAETPLDLPVASSPGSPYLVQVERRAMACQFAVLLPAVEGQLATETAIEALDLVDALESQMTIYRPASEVLDINRLAHDEPVPVEPRLFELLELALGLWRETDGALDITSGPLSVAWGFSRRQGRLPTDEEREAALARIDCGAIELNPQRRTIHLRRPDVEINLNAIGKGYALDRCRELFTEAGVANYLVHGGNSSVLASGNRTPAATGNRTLVQPSGDTHGDAAPPAGDESWVVGLRHPLRPGQRLLQVRLADRALGTSGTAAQNFTYRGRRYGHILDPRSGRPAEGVLSSTVLAPSAALADALSTAFYVMGLTQALHYCDLHPELAAILVTPGERAGSIEVHTAGLTEEEWWMVGKEDGTS